VMDCARAKRRPKRVHRPGLAKNIRERHPRCMRGPVRAVNSER
jgi:hypothetical protein